MGMFDYVDYEMECPQCGEIVRYFQSKDGDCRMATLNIKDVFSFYNVCVHCRLCIEFKRKPAKSIDDFDMVTEKFKGVQ
jgi:hypothetical protein